MGGLDSQLLTSPKQAHPTLFLRLVLRLRSRAAKYWTRHPKLGSSRPVHKPGLSNVAQTQLLHSGG